MSSAISESSPQDPAAKDGEATERFRVVDDDGHRALVANGVILSIAVEGTEPPSGYWAAMLPEGTPRSALLLGLGGGTLAHLLVRRYPSIEMVGVDTDRELIQFAVQRFGLNIPTLEIVIGNAFDYVQSCNRPFDFVAVDLFAGHDFQRGAVSKPFLRRLEWIAGPRGEIVFNLFKDRRTELHLGRIGRVLRLHRRHLVGRNVVVHCRGQ